MTIDSYQVELDSTTSLMPPEIPEKTEEVITRKVNSLNDWALVGQFIAFTYPCVQRITLFLSIMSR